MKNVVKTLVIVVALITVLGSARATTLLDGEKVAVLRPLIASGGNTNATTGGVDKNITGASVMDTDEVAGRVIPRLASELKWPIVNYNKTLEVQGTVVGSTDESHWSPRFRQYRMIGDKLNVRYIVSYVVRELSVHSAGSFLAKRKTGRANIDLLVYDRTKDAFVWQANIVDTSSAPSRVLISRSSERLDQSLFNALRTALTPFIEKGERKDIARPVTSLAATVKSVSGKTVLLDAGFSADIAVGDEFKEIGGKCLVKVSEILQNGILAEIVEGNTLSGDVCRLVD